MVHISKISKERINRVEDVLTLGDMVKVVCLGKDKMGRISFSMKDVDKENKENKENKEHKEYAEKKAEKHSEQ